MALRLSDCFDEVSKAVIVSSGWIDYRTLAVRQRISFDAAKRVLLRFWKDHSDLVPLFHVKIALKEENGIHVAIIDETALRKVNLADILSIHVYSLQRQIPQDLNLIPSIEEYTKELDNIEVHSAVSFEFTIEERPKNEANILKEESTQFTSDSLSSSEMPRLQSQSPGQGSQDISQKTKEDLKKETKKMEEPKVKSAKSTRKKVPQMKTTEKRKQKAGASSGGKKQARRKRSILDSLRRSFATQDEKGSQGLKPSEEIPKTQVQVVKEDNTEESLEPGRIDILAESEERSASETEKELEQQQEAMQYEEEMHPPEQVEEGKEVMENPAEPPTEEIEIEAQVVPMDQDREESAGEHDSGVTREVQIRKNGKVLVTETYVDKEGYLVCKDVWIDDPSLNKTSAGETPSNDDLSEKQRLQSGEAGEKMDQKQSQNQRRKKKGRTLFDYMG